MKEEDEPWRVLLELSSTIINILKSPQIPYLSNSFSSSSSPSPTAFASLFLGISLAMMLFGSLTFFIGFILMPLLTGFVFLFYFLNILFHFSQFATSILCPNSSPTVFPAFRENGRSKRY